MNEFGDAMKSKVLQFAYKISVALLLSGMFSSLQAESCKTIHSQKSKEYEMLYEDIKSLIGSYKGIELVRDVKFEVSATPYEKSRAKKFAGSRDVLIVSVSEMGKRKRKQFKNELLEVLDKSTISFPLSTGFHHLYSRVDGHVYDHLSGVEKNNYELPEYSDRFEPIMLLSKSEKEKLVKYVKNANEKYDQVIGDFEYDGAEKSIGLVTNNKGICGAHNCTSWMAYAPVGANRLRLLEAAGGDLKKDKVGQNPGWWALFLSTKAERERAPLVIYWTSQTVKEMKEKIKSGEVFDMSFSEH